MGPTSQVFQVCDKGTLSLRPNTVDVLPWLRQPGLYAHVFYPCCALLARYAHSSFADMTGVGHLRTVKRVSSTKNQHNDGGIVDGSC